MGVMDKFLNAMRLNGDMNEDESDENDEGYYDEPDFTETKSERNSSNSNNTEDDTKIKKAPIKAVTPIKSVRRSNTGISNTGMEVCVIKPTSFEESREITETLLGNRTVVLNLEGLDVDLAQRIIDFTSGSCFAIKGNLQKISHYIFIITPASVDISGDFQEMISDTFTGPSHYNL